MRSWDLGNFFCSFYYSDAISQVTGVYSPHCVATVTLFYNLSISLH